MGGQLHIPAVKCSRVESNFHDENNLLENEVEYFKHRIRRHFQDLSDIPHGSVSRLNTDELLLAASASYKF